MDIFEFKVDGPYLTCVILSDEKRIRYLVSVLRAQGCKSSRAQGCKATRAKRGKKDLWGIRIREKQRLTNDDSMPNILRFKAKTKTKTTPISAFSFPDKQIVKRKRKREDVRNRGLNSDSDTDTPGIWVDVDILGVES